MGSPVQPVVNVDAEVCVRGYHREWDAFDGVRSGAWMTLVGDAHHVALRGLENHLPRVSPVV